MSLNDYEKAKYKISFSRKNVHFSGPQSTSSVQKAQDRLGVEFPLTYAKFLCEYGAGGIGSFELYGLTGQENNSTGVPDVIWYTEKGRKEWKLPQHLIPIYDLGDGEIYCLDLGPIKSEEGEAPVIAITPGYSDYSLSLDLVAEDFGALLLSLVDLEDRINKSKQ
jgi:antitoxin YobK